MINSERRVMGAFAGIFGDKHAKIKRLRNKQRRLEAKREGYQQQMIALEEQNKIKRKKLDEYLEIERNDFVHVGPARTLEKEIGEDDHTIFLLGSAIEDLNKKIAGLDEKIGHLDRAA